MGKSIHPMCAEKPGAVLVLHYRRSSVRMSLQPAIPWRVALQQSPTPLHRLSIILKEKQSLEKTITLNGNCVFGKLSHSKGSSQPGEPSLRMKSITPGSILKWKTAGTIINIVNDEESRLYPSRSLNPVHGKSVGDENTKQRSCEGSAQRNTIGNL